MQSGAGQLASCDGQHVLGQLESFQPVEEVGEVHQVATRAAADIEHGPRCRSPGVNHLGDVLGLGPVVLSSARVEIVMDLGDVTSVHGAPFR
jgi:hypothetical protein